MAVPSSLLVVDLNQLFTRMQAFYDGKCKQCVTAVWYQLRF